MDFVIKSEGGVSELLDKLVKTGSCADVLRKNWNKIKDSGYGLGSRRDFSWARFLFNNRHEKILPIAQGLFEGKILGYIGAPYNLEVIEGFAELGDRLCKRIVDYFGGEESYSKDRYGVAMILQRQGISRDLLLRRTDKESYKGMMKGEIPIGWGCDKKGKRVECYLGDGRGVLGKNGWVVA